MKPKSRVTKRSVPPNHVSHPAQTPASYSKAEIPTGDTWRVVVEVPQHVDRDGLFKAVADAVHDWEPEDRDGWDANVYGEPVPAEEEP